MFHSICIPIFMWFLQRNTEKSSFEYVHVICLLTPKCQPGRVWPIFSTATQSPRYLELKSSYTVRLGLLAVQVWPCPGILLFWDTLLRCCRENRPRTEKLQSSFTFLLCARGMPSCREQPRTIPSWGLLVVWSSAVVPGPVILHLFSSLCAVFSHYRSRII